MFRKCSFRILIFFGIILLSCSSEKNSRNSEENSDSTIIDSISTSDIDADTTSDVDIEVSEYETYFIVIADTGNDYYPLYEKMFDISRIFSISIDTLGRSYNKEKNLIALPEDSEDEIYAGEYFPRRFPSENLSLEYLNFYNPKTGGNTIALVAGIYESKADADSTLNILKKEIKQAFTMEAEVFIGCMH